jgi:hypothetical protein
MAMTIRPWHIHTTAEGTRAIISIDIPPERKKAKNRAPATTAAADPRERSPTTIPSNP